MRNLAIATVLRLACYLGVVLVGSEHISTAQTFANWLDTQNETDLRISAKLAKQHDGINTLASDMPNLVLFLPNNQAWAAVPEWVDAFESDPDLRYDMILASGAEVRKSKQGAFNALKVHQEKYGMLDSGYGTPYFLEGNDQLCVGIWSDRLGDYTADQSQCATLSVPTYLSDATVFKISAVVLPTELTDQFGH